MTTLRLSVCGGDVPCERTALRRGGVGERPALLISYPYLSRWDTIIRPFIYYRDWALDSGAFTANKSGQPIDLVQYTEVAKFLRATDPLLVDVFGLDSIASWQASAKNYAQQMAMGLPIVPTFHGGEPWDVLTGLVRDYPKVALGGVAMWPLNKKTLWVRECFSRIWPVMGPYPIHGFGIMSRTILEAFPFHSVDASNWEVGPLVYGKWRAFGVRGRAGRPGMRGHGGLSLRPEVDFYLRLERELQWRWSKELLAMNFQR